MVRHVVAGGDALVLAPTGGGKSICFQVPALCRPGTAVVISPLIALMDDQVAALRQLGVAAGALHSDLDPAEARSVTRDLIEQQLDLLYVSPERLLANGTLERLSRLRLALFAIDEAHCVSQWGHEFRPEYRGLACLADQFPGVPRVALTATADPRTRDDILRALKMEPAETFVASFHRAEPAYRRGAEGRRDRAASRSAGAPLRRLRHRLLRHAARRPSAWRQRLRDKGIPAIAFHAGLEPRRSARRWRGSVRANRWSWWRRSPSAWGSTGPMCASSCISTCRTVRRRTISRSAARDVTAIPADTLLLYGGQDIAQARHWLAQSAAPEIAEARDAHQARGDDRAHRGGDLPHAGRCSAASARIWPEPCGHCDNCAAPPLMVDATVEAQKVLSAVYRTDQLFGALHIIAVLRGETTDGVLRHGHDRLPTFGVGADHAAPYWRGLIRQLIALGALDVDTAGHGGLFLVQDKARPILRGEARVMLRQEGRRRTEVRASGPRCRRRSAQSARRCRRLFEALRAWRAAEAKAQRIPPYVIFHDTVLREIAAVRPASIEELGQIKGVGASKLQRYGAAVLAILGGIPRLICTSNV